MGRRRTGSEVSILTAQPTAPGQGWHVPQNSPPGALHSWATPRPDGFAQVQNNVVMSDVGNDAWPCAWFMEALRMSCRKGQGNPCVTISMERGTCHQLGTTTQLGQPSCPRTGHAYRDTPKHAPRRSFQGVSDEVGKFFPK